MNWVAIPRYRREKAWLLVLHCGHLKKVSMVMHTGWAFCALCQLAQRIMDLTEIPETSL